MGVPNLERWTCMPGLHHNKDPSQCPNHPSRPIAMSLPKCAVTAPPNCFDKDFFIIHTKGRDVYPLCNYWKSSVPEANAVVAKDQTDASQPQWSTKGMQPKHLHKMMNLPTCLLIKGFLHLKINLPVCHPTPSQALSLQVSSRLPWRLEA